MGDRRLRRHIESKTETELTLQTIVDRLNEVRSRYQNYEEAYRFLTALFLSLASKLEHNSLDEYKVYTKNGFLIEANSFYFSFTKGKSTLSTIALWSNETARNQIVDEIFNFNSYSN